MSAAEDRLRGAVPDAAADPEGVSPGDDAPRGRRRRRRRSRSDVKVAPTGDRVGEVLDGTYRVERLIARGGMGEVYEVAHTRLQQRFAVKFLEQSYTSNREAFARFRQEAEIAAGLNHQSIAQVFDFNTDDHGNPYMVMEYVQGQTLDAWISQHPLDDRAILGVFEPLCLALDAAHQAGIIHRDLKPSNIMVERDQNGEFAVKLLDFGISKIKHDGDDGMTRDNVVMGTPNYMSPEQASGQNRDIDARTDIHALGAILYECISGRKAYSAEGLPPLLHAIVYGQPKPIAEVAPKAPAQISVVIDRCLAKDPNDRFPSARVLLRAITAAYRPPQPEAEPSRPRVERVVVERRGRPSLLWVFAWVTSLATVGAAAFAVAGDRALLGAAISGTPGSATPTPQARPAAALTPPPVARYSGREALPGALILEASGRLYQAEKGGLRFWGDAEAEPRTVALPTAAAVGAMAMSGDDRELVVAQVDGTISRWDNQVREPIWHKRMSKREINTVAAAGGYLAFATDSGLVLANQQTGKILKTFRPPEATRALALTRGTAATLLAFGDEALGVYDADRRRAVDTVELPAGTFRGGVQVEVGDQPPLIWTESLQGDWIVRRTYRLHRPSPKSVRLELVGQELR